MKKTSLPRIIMIICVVWISFGIGAVAMLLFHMAPEIIPHTKTDFASYEEFREATLNYFPDQLPDSAREIRYYTYVGKMDNISAIAFVLDKQDYVLVSDRYKAFFFDYDSRYENQACTNQFVQDQQLLFLKYLTEEDCEKYQIIEYVALGSSPRITKIGIWGNESTGEMILFYFVDIFPKEVNSQ